MLKPMLLLPSQPAAHAPHFTVAGAPGPADPQSPILPMPGLLALVLPEGREGPHRAVSG